MEFLYDSGISVGRTGNSEGFKALEAFPKPDASDAPSSSASASKVFDVLDRIEVFLQSMFSFNV